MWDTGECQNKKRGVDFLHMKLDDKGACAALFVLRLTLLSKASCIFISCLSSLISTSLAFSSAAAFKCLRLQYSLLLSAT